jgi:hypothetical protein
MSVKKIGISAIAIVAVAVFVIAILSTNFVNVPSGTK